MIGTLKNVTAADQANYTCELEFVGDSRFEFTGQGQFKVYKQPELRVHVNNPLDLETSVQLGWSYYVLNKYFVRIRFVALYKKCLIRSFT